MKRGGGADIFLRSIEKMRRTIPDVTLRTSFIVGFPGETEKEFDELCEVRQRSRSSTGWALSAIPIRKAPEPSTIDKKLSAREIEGRRKKLMSHPEENQPRQEKSR